MRHGKLYTQLMNSREWRALRAKKLAANPLCELHQQQGKVVAASCVHHIVEVESGTTESECRRLAYSWSNLQSLCRECHAAIHKAKRSHSRQAHQQRANEALERWKARQAAAMQTPGVDFFSIPPTFPKSTCPSSN